MAAITVDPTIRRRVMSAAREVHAEDGFVGPVFFHLMTRPAVERIIALPMDPEAAVDELVAASLAGLRA